MELGFIKRRKILKNSSLLDLTPFRKIDHEISEEGIVTLLCPKFTNKTLERFIMGNRSPYIHLKLDETGTACWILIDGKKNVGTIAEEMKQKLQDKEQIHERLSKFMTLLYSNKYISFKELQKGGEIIWGLF